MARLVQDARTRFPRDPGVLHAAGAILWGAVLAGSACLSEPSSLRDVLLAGLGPVLAGLLFFFAMRETPVGEMVLLFGERVGVALGAGMLSHAAAPLLLFALGPEVRAARRERTGQRWVGVGATLALYLAAGLWHNPERALLLVLGAVLYGAVLAAVPAVLGKHAGEPAGAEVRSGADLGSPEQSQPTARPELTPAGVAPDQESLLQDLRVARDIQVSLLLASSPSLPGWETSASFLPARELGGDL
ncbi:MAG: hypothetical protein ACP5SI_00375, partial [Chloroflexia bacterium]